MTIWSTISLILFIVAIILAIVADQQARKAIAYKEMYESEHRYVKLQQAANLQKAIETADAKVAKPADPHRAWTEKTVTTVTKPAEKTVKAKKTATKTAKAKKTTTAVKVHDVTKLKKGKKAV